MPTSSQQSRYRCRSAADVNLEKACAFFAAGIRFFLVDELGFSGCEYHCRIFGTDAVQHCINNQAANIDDRKVDVEAITV
jgi:hypothetical protein